VAYIGRITDGQKNVLILPRIAQRLEELGYINQVSWTIAGGGEDLGALQDAFAHSASTVRFTGPVSATEIPKLMFEHDVLILPSRWEGLPLVLLEAMAAGLVPVCSHLPGITDFLVKDGESGFLINGGSEEHYARAIARLAENRDELSRLSARARETAHSRFSGEATFGKIGDIIATRLPSRPIHKEVSLHQLDIPGADRLAALPAPIRDPLRIAYRLLKGNRSHVSRESS